MSSVYTPSATIHGSYVLPSDGDPAVAESVNDALRDLADGVLNANTNASAALALASQMINGVTGGSYSPSGPITLNGSTLNLHNNGLFIDGSSGLVVDSSFTVSTSGWTFSTPGVVSGDVSFNTGIVNFEEFTTSGTAHIFSLSVRGDSGIGNSASDSLTVLATSTFESPVTIESTLEINGITSFNNAASFGDAVVLGSNASNAITVLGQLFLTSRLRYQDSGRVPFRVLVLPDASASLNVSDGNVFFVRTDITALRTYTISDSGAVDGDFMLFMSGASTVVPFNVVITSPTFGQSSSWVGGNNSQWNLFVRAGGDWYKMNFAAGL